VTPAQVLAERTRLLADRTGLDPARVAAWATARGIESALWAAGRGWWAEADGELDRSREWATAMTRLGG
jgi:streptomycin 6-kinase